jgi:hypothetical protein
VRGGALRDDQVGDRPDQGEIAGERGRHRDDEPCPLRIGQPSSAPPARSS